MKLNLNDQITIVVLIVSIVFVVKEILIPLGYSFYRNQKTRNQIKKMMENKKINKENLKEELIIEIMADLNNIKKDTCVINNMTIKRGDRVSFQTLDYGLLAGEFLGLTPSKAEGYTYHWYMKRRKHDKEYDEVIAIPIETIIEETVVCYRN